MIISPGRGYVFVHIPKTGGTALAGALEARARSDDILIGDTPKARRRRHRLRTLSSHGRLWKHSRLSDIEGVVARDALAEMFVFTIVRNPWDRVVSYYHWLRAQTFDHPAVALARKLDFSDFVAHPQTGAALSADAARHYVTLTDGREVATTFLRFERLEDEVAALGDRLGLKLGPVARTNASDRARDWRVYYDWPTRQIVARACAEDIARFGYCFDGEGG